MKKILFIISVIFLSFTGKEPIPKKVYFTGGERIEYKVHYGFITAGEVVVTIDTSLHEVYNQVCYKADVVGQTVGAVGLFANIVDKWTSYIDTSSLLSHKFVRDQKENNYTLNEITEFDRKENVVLVTRKKDDNSFELKGYNIKAGVQDMVSTYFELRNYDFDKLEKNQLLYINMFLEDTTLAIKIKYLGKEKVKTKIGKLKAFVFTPVLPETKNTIFAKEDPVKAWISDDAFRIPVKIKANTKFGAVEVDITEYKKPLKR